MQLKIRLDGVPLKFQDDYVNFVFEKINQSLKDLVESNRDKYEVRESFVKNSETFKWIDDKVPKRIVLSKYVEECLELFSTRGEYFVRVNSQKVVKGSITGVDVLVRMLEYGAEGLPELPVVRRVFNLYRNEIFMDEFYKEVCK